MTGGGPCTGFSKEERWGFATQVSEGPLKSVEKTSFSGSSSLGGKEIEFLPSVIRDGITTVT